MSEYVTNETEYTDPKQSSIGLAVAALIISLVNLLLFNSLLSFICVPIALIFAIMSLVQHRRGKIMAIVSIVASVISAVIFSLYVAFVIKVYPDFEYFIRNDDRIIAEYNADGTIPAYYDKYKDKKYDMYWDSLGYDSFDSLFRDFVKSYESQKAETAEPATESNGEKATAEKATEKDDSLVDLA